MEVRASVIHLLGGLDLVWLRPVRHQKPQSLPDHLPVLVQAYAAPSASGAHHQAASWAATKPAATVAPPTSASLTTSQRVLVMVPTLADPQPGVLRLSSIVAIGA